VGFSVCRIFAAARVAQAFSIHEMATSSASAGQRFQRSLTQCAIHVPVDDSEQVANAYLHHLGFESVVFEPDGNVPPDFLVDHRIAVEVRRLNQNEQMGPRFRGLEEVAIPLHMKISKLLAALGPPKSGISWFVSYDFRRPVPAWKVLRSELRERLLLFRDDAVDTDTTMCVGDGFELRLIRASTAHKTRFVPGGYGDDDSGGCVFGETQRNLRLCVEEKTQKIVPFRGKYGQWWLILIDHIGYGVDQCDRQLYRDHLRVPHTWEKVILLNPLDHRCAFEISPTRMK
jgi:hypothetical protein